MRQLIAILWLICLGSRDASSQENDPFGWRAELQVRPVLAPIRPYRILDFLNPGFRSIDADRRIPESQIPLYRQAAKTLAEANLATPPERVGRFAWLIGPDFRGWDGVVSNVTTTPEGLIVTVQISPHLDMAICGDFVIERYQITNGTVSWLGGDYRDQKTHHELLGF